MALEDVVAVLREQHGIVCGSVRSIGGGSINRAFRVASDVGPLFVKTHGAGSLAMFEAEAAGLEALRAADAVAIPEVVAVGAGQNTAFLVLAWVELVAGDARAAARLGRELAIQHSVTQPSFGWSRDNTIGSTPQLNPVCPDWLSFFRQHRLGFQLELAARNGLPTKLRTDFELLLERMEAFFGAYRPRPALLHGDLWGGNWGSAADGRPFLFDPAVYFGDREADIAMTRLFGGFGAEFYASYAEQWPLPDGAEMRVSLYNLYHLLNHFNLFGAGYLPAIAAGLERLKTLP